MNIARIVLFSYTVKDGRDYNNGSQIAPAIVNRNWGGNCLNLTVFPDGTPPASKTSVPQATSLAGFATGYQWATYEQLKEWGVDTASKDPNGEIWKNIPEAAN